MIQDGADKVPVCFFICDLR